MRLHTQLKCFNELIKGMKEISFKKGEVFNASGFNYQKVSFFSALSP